MSRTFMCDGCFRKFLCAVHVQHNSANDAALVRKDIDDAVTVTTRLSIRDGQSALIKSVCKLGLSQTHSFLEIHLHSYYH